MDGVVCYERPSSVEFMKEIPYFRRNLLKDFVLNGLFYIAYIVLYLLRPIIRTYPITFSSVIIDKLLPILQPVSIDQNSLLFM